MIKMTPVKLSKYAKTIRYDEVHDWWDKESQIASYDGFNLGYATAKKEMEEKMKKTATKKPVKKVTKTSKKK